MDNTTNQILVRLVVRVEGVLLSTIHLATIQAINDTAQIKKLADVYRSFLADIKSDIRLVGASFEDHTPEQEGELWRDALAGKANVPQ